MKNSLTFVTDLAKISIKKRTLISNIKEYKIMKILIV